MIAAAVVAAIGIMAAAEPIPLGVIRSGGTTYTISVNPGTAGLLNGRVSLEARGSSRSFSGFNVVITGAPLVKGLGWPVTSGVRILREHGGVTGRHRVVTATGPCDLVISLAIDRGAVATSIFLDGIPTGSMGNRIRIESAAVGIWDEPVERVYAGAGNVLVLGPDSHQAPDPDKEGETWPGFTLDYDGHRLSTSFAGFEWFDGPAVVVATDAVPESMFVNPVAGFAGINAPGPQMITIIPGATAWDALRVWRESFAPPASPGFTKLAGRFVFDLWGGTFEAARKALEQSFRYGCTDAVVIWHNWQRYGYDVRLPDIWPPRQDVGTVAEMRALADLCREHGVLFAPHDNYIDFYPDAEGFSPDRLCHDEAGKPVKAWLNSWAKAPEPQSYRWRPDKVRPFVERNLALIGPAIAPTAYFTDVWSSIGPHDWRERNGTFHARSETRRIWGEMFSMMRDRLGGAPQISESGHDALIGQLDGATANHLRVGPAPEGQWSVWRIPCEDAERIPWFDFAYHDRFALHGAGYEDRYAAGLDVKEHGIYSDDYLSTLVLTGRPAMVKDAMSPDAVRVYWLLHDVMRAVAGRRIESVGFDHGDIHRQRVTWEGGGEALVNRGAGDWVVDGLTLPQYGFRIRVPGAGGVHLASVDRVHGLWRERASWPGGRYLGARPPRPVIRCTPGKPRMTGRETFILPLTWGAGRTTELPLTVFVHFTDAAGRIVFQGDHPLPVSSTAWSGTIRTEARVRIPPTVNPKGVYAAGVGLWHPASGGRAELAGPDPEGQRRYRVGTLKLGTGNGLTWTAEPAGDPADIRRNPGGTMVSADGWATDGECRIVDGNEAFLVTPLPGSGPVRMVIRGEPMTIRPVAGEISVTVYNGEP